MCVPARPCSLGVSTEFSVRCPACGWDGGVLVDHVDSLNFQIVRHSAGSWSINANVTYTEGPNDALGLLIHACDGAAGRLAARREPLPVLSAAEMIARRGVHGTKDDQDFLTVDRIVDMRPDAVRQAFAAIRTRRR